VVTTVVAVLGLSLVGPSHSQVRLTVLGGVIGGGPYLQAAALSQVLSEHLRGVATATVQATPGLHANAVRLAAGLGDIAVVVTVDGLEVLQRRGGFAEARRFPLQMYPTMPPQYVHFIVTQRSGITRFSDLNGKRINMLTRGSLAQRVGTRLLEVLRLRPSHLFHFPHGDAAAALLRGDIDVAVAGAIAPAYYEVSLREPLRILSFTAEEMELVRERMPELPIAEADFGRSYRGAGKAWVLAPWAVMAARHDLDADLVYQITKAVFDNFSTVVRIYREAEGMTPHTVLQTRFPLHPGALRFYREVGIRIPTEMLPPAGLPR
jgi:TRAP transporter TAXI family solute receptor